MISIYLQIINNIQKETYFKPLRNWPKYYFDKRIYEIEALNDIKELIRSNASYEHPSSIIYNYMNYNKRLLLKEDMPKKLTFILETKIDVAENIGYYFV